ncbi:probable N-acetyltransferase camello [Megalops cyprinoides]|uniref:probable N-acetyltransferase camello n=1 Tax=Megalops cyprinoides TaxID=118141 RepID=UPI001863DC81|nr:probable N-acetyltransferase camello [Megalops cyprinoides]
MASFQIRKYRDEDDEVVKEIFTMGMIEHVPSSFVHVLKQPLTQMVLTCVFCALLASSKSFLLPVLAVTLLLAGVRQLVSYLFTSYIDTSLKEDLRSIREAYMEKKDACFWVAESEGRVVATVACLPCAAQPECMELKRMSVRRSHRGLGIGKALCRTVADFTQERGYPAVVLFTSVVQTDAQKLYEHMGYSKMRQFVIPSLEGRVTNFSIIEYRLEVQEGKIS